jgi:hypothetical protein
VDNFGVWREREFAPGVRYYEVGRRYVEDSRSILRYPEPSSTLTAP